MTSFHFNSFLSELFMRYLIFFDIYRCIGVGIVNFRDVTFRQATVKDLDAIVQMLAVEVLAVS